MKTDGNVATITLCKKVKSMHTLALNNLLKNKKECTQTNGAVVILPDAVKCFSIAPCAFIFVMDGLIHP